MMNEVCKKFLDDLSNLLPSVRETCQATIDYWQPDEPPLTTIFGNVGQVIVENFEVIEPELRTKVMNLIEAGALTDDDQLGIAVFTGLIEGMTGAAAKTKGRTEIILEEFGPRSKWHAKAWLGLS